MHAQLMVASDRGEVEVMELLLAEERIRAMIDTQDQDGLSPSAALGCYGGSGKDNQAAFVTWCQAYPSKWYRADSLDDCCY